MPIYIVLGGCLSHVFLLPSGDDVVRFRDTGNGGRAFFCLNRETVQHYEIKFINRTRYRKPETRTSIQSFFLDCGSEILQCHAWRNYLL